MRLKTVYSTCRWISVAVLSCVVCTSAIWYYNHRQWLAEKDRAGYLNPRNWPLIFAGAGPRDIEKSMGKALTQQPFGGPLDQRRYLRQEVKPLSFELGKQPGFGSGLSWGKK